MKKHGTKSKSSKRGGKASARSVKARGRKSPARKTAGKTRRGGRGRDNRTLLAAGAIAKATARAQASVRTELGAKSMVAEKMAEDALNEAQELGLLLEGQDEDEEEPAGGSDEENAYFIKAPPLGPPHARVRPAPGIERGTIPPLRVKRARAGGSRRATDKRAGAAVSQQNRR